MNNFAFNLVMRGAGIGPSYIFRPARSAIFSQIFNSSPPIAERESSEQCNLTESKALSAVDEYSESLISHSEKPSAPPIPFSSSPKSNLLDNSGQVKLIGTKPAGSDHSEYIQTPYIVSDLAELKKVSQSPSESRSPPIPKSNDLQSKSAGKKIVVGRNDTSSNTTSHEGPENRNIDPIIRSDIQQLKALEPQTQTSDIEIRADYAHKMATVFPGILNAFEHKAPTEDLAPSELINASQREISNPLSEDLPLIMPRLPMKTSASERRQSSLKGPELKEERPVQIRIGAIEVRAINPPSNPSSAPISLPKSFDEYYLARNYFNQ